MKRGRRIKLTSEETALGCLDLEVRFGSKYRIGWEDNGSNREGTPRAEHPWIRTIECLYGSVFVHGGEILGAFTPNRRIGKQLRRLPFLEHVQGDVETVIRFHASHLPEVLALLRPRRRRTLSAEHRAKLVEAGSRHRFKAGVSSGSEGQLPAAGATNEREPYHRGPVTAERPETGVSPVTGDEA